VLEGEIMQSRTIGRAVHAKINITDAQMEEFFEQNMRGQERTGPRVRIQQILMLIPRGASASKISDIEKAMKDLHKRILAGEDFGKLAVKYSEGAGAQLGGDIGFFHRGELMPDIEELAFTLDKGKVSPVFRTELGFHLIKVIDRIGDAGDNATGPATGTWKDRKKDIHDILYGTQFEKEITQWMKGLKEKAYVEIN
jgi:parvulin-like peptidyl-prolyl isomerase